MVGIVRPRFALCGAGTAREAGIHDRRGAYARTGDRRECGDVFGRGSSALSRPGDAARRDDDASHIPRARPSAARSSLGNGIPFARYVDLTNWTSSFSRMAQLTRRDIAVGNGGDSREMSVGIVSASFFDFFDAPPTIGRNFTTAEDSTPAGAPVAVLGYSYWQTGYGGRRDAIGQTIRVGPLVYTIIGVEPAGFGGVWPDQPPVVYIPISSYASTQTLNQKGKTWWTTYNWTWSQTIAMRKPGVSVARADADLTAAYLRSYRVQVADQPRSTPIDLVKPRAIAASIRSPARPESEPALEGRRMDWRCGTDRPADCMRERRQPVARARAQPAAAKLRCASRSESVAGAWSPSCSRRACCSALLGGTAGLAPRADRRGVPARSVPAKVDAGAGTRRPDARCSSPRLRLLLRDCSPGSHRRFNSAAST